MKADSNSEPNRHWQQIGPSKAEHPRPCHSEQNDTLRFISLVMRTQETRNKKQQIVVSEKKKRVKGASERERQAMGMPVAVTGRQRHSLTLTPALNQSLLKPGVRITVTGSLRTPARPPTATGQAQAHVLCISRRWLIMTIMTAMTSVTSVLCM